MNEDMRWENTCPECKRHRRDCGCDLTKGMTAPKVQNEPTPRTDAEAERCIGEGSPMSYVRAIDHARQLERELIAMRKAFAVSSTDEENKLRAQLTAANSALQEMVDADLQCACSSYDAPSRLRYTKAVAKARDALVKP